MKAYQEKYIRNLESVMSLSDFNTEIPGDIPEFVRNRSKNNEKIRAIIAENTDLLRENLIPVLDNIVSASEEEVAELEDFASHLLRGARQLDLVLNYILRNALVGYARKHNKRDMLIRQLYHMGMALFYMQEIIVQADKYDYCWKMSMMFGEAAAYIKKYDEIEDVDTRGFIHRSMANLVLAYHWNVPEEAERKIVAIRRSFQVLTDPAYHAKTPSLPWDVFLYKSHQERTTAMMLLRKGEADAQIVREVMESAEYVWKKQLEDSKKRGTKPAIRWMLEYDIALYHCGVLTLPQLLQSMEKAFMDRDSGDFTLDGIFGNTMLPAFYAEYMRNDPSYIQKKKDVLLYMYGQMVKYVHRMPNTQLNNRLNYNLLEGFQTFIEYPDGIQAKDFLINLVVCRDPDIYVYLQLTADFAKMIAEEAVEYVPEQLTGVLGACSSAEVRDKKEEIVQFTYECGILHDIGLFLFSNLVTSAARKLFEEEQRMYNFHVNAGKLILSRCESTKKYVPVALGHHRYFDGSGGYPEEYHREEDPNVQITDIVSIASYVVGLMDAKFGEDRTERTLDEALRGAENFAGTRFSPIFAGLLPRIAGKLELYMKDSVERAYEKAFNILRGEG